MSVAFTEQAVVERRKTVTRRKGWLFLKPGDRLTLCRKVMGRKKGESGQVQFGYREEIKAGAGVAGNLDIPEKFTLGLAPFEGGKPYQVLARLRFSIDDQKLRIRYVLDRPAEIVRAAFDEVVGVIAAGVAAPLYHGRTA